MIIAEAGLSAIMDYNPAIARDDSNLFNGFEPAFGMQKLQGDIACRIHIILEFFSKTQDYYAPK